jgi:hypothetical protein
MEVPLYDSCPADAILSWWGGVSVAAERCQFLGFGPYTASTNPIDADGSSDESGDGANRYLDDYAYGRLEAARYLARLPKYSGGKTEGILRAGSKEMPLHSGWDGPASQLPKGTRGFDIVTRTHVEGHAAAVMRMEGLQEATLYINNPPCPSCTKLLPRMLPKGAELTIYGPHDYMGVFRGI